MEARCYDMTVKAVRPLAFSTFDITLRWRICMALWPTGIGLLYSEGYVGAGAVNSGNC